MPSKIRRRVPTSWVERIADHVVEVVIHEALGVREKPIGCMKMTRRAPPALAKNRARLSKGSVSSRPRRSIDLDPAQAELLHAALELGHGQIDFCKGTVPRPTKRSGQVATICASCR